MPGSGALYCSALIGCVWAAACDWLLEVSGRVPWWLLPRLTSSPQPGHLSLSHTTVSFSETENCHKCLLARVIKPPDAKSRAVSLSALWPGPDSQQLGSTDVCLNGTIGQFQHGAFFRLSTLHSHILSHHSLHGNQQFHMWVGESVQTIGCNSTELAQAKWCIYFLFIIFCGIWGVTLLKMLQMFCFSFNGASNRLEQQEE